ncbi:WxL domain-containing protein [Vagococcus penaei]|uniref:hypothetical protein n=1 Tax=Vagococcus penaei TaxID=633807 RepID=UPI0013725D28|nr:hypothetical protein [Vagococcus penaei]
MFQQRHLRSHQQNANRGDYSFNLNQQNDIQLKVNSNQGLAGEKYQSVITFNLTDAK